MNMHVSPTPLDIVLLLHRARTSIVREVDRAVNAHGIGFSDFTLLRELSSTPEGRMRRSDLAETLGVTTSAVARQLVPLERIGVVARESNPRDARIALVVLTEAGARVVEEATVIAQERSESALDRIWSRDEREQLANLLANAAPR